MAHKIHQAAGLVLSCLLLIAEDSSTIQDIATPLIGDMPGLKFAKEKHRFPRVPVVAGGGNVTFSPDGRLIASRDKISINVWDASSGEMKFTAPCKTPYERVDFSADGATFFSVEGGAIKRFTLDRQREVSSVVFKGRFEAFLPGEKQFLLFQDGVIEIRNTNDGSLVRDFRVHRNQIGIGRSILSADGKLLATSVSVEQMIRIWRVGSGEQQAVMKGHEKRIQKICFSLTGKWVASTGEDKTARIWDAATGQLIKNIPLNDVGLDVAFSHDEKWLAVGTVGRTSEITIRDAKSGEEVAALTPEPNGSRQVLFNRQGTMLAATGGRWVQVWEISEQKAKSKQNPKK